jgi:hypothetical protein
MFPRRRILGLLSVVIVERSALEKEAQKRKTKVGETVVPRVLWRRC